VGGEAPVTPVSSPNSSFQTFPTNRAITGLCYVFELLDALLGISCICLINLIMRYDLHCYDV
jgi:hypothetical protein